MADDVEEIVLSHGDISIYASDLETLFEGNWLTDRILSFAINYLYETMLNDDEKESVYFFFRFLFFISYHCFIFYLTILLLYLLYLLIYLIY